MLEDTLILYYSDVIKQNKTGILRGARIKKDEGKITEAQEKEIISMVNLASFRDFRPLMYIIPVDKIRSLCEKVDPGERANPLSQEYKINSLPGRFFDIIEL